MTVPALACSIEPIEPTGVVPATLSLYNDPVAGDPDTLTLFALNLSDSGSFFNLEFEEAGSGAWRNFNPVFGSFFDDELNLTTFTFDQAAEVTGLNLRLLDCQGVVSTQAEITFHSFQALIDGYDWFNWVELSWFDDSGNPLDVSTALTAWLPWDSEDMVGTTAVPIPGSGILLGLGVLCLIGRRRHSK